MRLHAALGLAILLASTTFAGVTDGPGGRIYFAGRATLADDVDNSVLIKSVAFNPDWTLADFETHGTIANARVDMSKYSGWSAHVAGDSPEIMSVSGGYATLGMGLWSNNTPVTGLVGVTGKQTMDVLRINTSAGSMVTTSLTDGRAYSAGGAHSTDGGRFAIPDVTGQLTGVAGGFLANGYRYDASWGHYYEFLTGSAPDIAGAFGPVNMRPAADVNDIEIVGNKAFVSTEWNGIYYITDQGAPGLGSDAGGFRFVSSAVTVGAGSPIAAGKVNGHDAVYYFGDSGGSQTSYAQIRAAVDLNDNGNAQDPGEDVVLVDRAAVSGFGAFDLELIQANGKMFLAGLDNLGLVITQSYDSAHNLMGIMELGATGMTVSGATVVDLGSNLSNGTIHLASMEFSLNTGPVPTTWDQTAGGNWNAASNWQPRAVPNGNTALVLLGSKIAAKSTVFCDVDVTVKSITFDNANKYVVAGAGSLTLAADGGNASISVLQGNHVFQLPVILAVDGTDVSVAGGATLTFDGALDLAGNTLTKAGAGTMYINNKLNLGTGGQIVVSEGAVELSGQLVLALGSIPTGALTLLDVGAGSVGGQFYGLAEGAEVDLGYNSTTYKFKISYAGGTGNNDVVLNLIPNHIPGDINGDLIVDQADYTVWYNHYGQTGATWEQGDVTNDGIVDQADYTVWYNHYGATGANVPEPMTMALLALGGLAMLRRRK